MIRKAIFILLLTGSQLTTQAQRTYKLDLKKSRILWKVETVGKHHGYIFFSSGNLNFTAKNEPKDGHFVVDMNTMHGLDGNAENQKKVDEKLRSADFFEVNKHPISTIVVKKVVSNKVAGHFKVFADLTIKGTTNPIEFDAVIKNAGNTLNATSHLLIDRRKWLIHYAPKPTGVFGSIKDKMIAGDIQIDIRLVFLP